jgi:hypothetical protein
MRNTLLSLVMVIKMEFSGAALDDTDVGGSTASTSGGFVFVARMKKDNNRKATSHMAVMSMLVLFLGNLALGIADRFV